MTKSPAVEKKKAQVRQHLGFAIRFISHVSSMS
jgi:hypothetical protein